MAYYGAATSSRNWLTQPKTLLILAGVLSIIGLGLIIQMFKPETAPTFSVSRKGPKVVVVRKVFVAKENLDPGTLLKGGMFSLESRPTEGPAEEFPSEISAIENFYAGSKIEKGSVLKASKVSNSWMPHGKITEIIPEGFRAVTIEVDQAEGIEGWAAPEARVDVTWSSEHRGKPMVSTLVENTKILSIERSIAPQRGAAPMNYSIPRSVTLLVSIKDAQKIQLARKSGELSLTLRGEADKRIAGPETLLVDNLLASAENPKDGDLKGTVSFDGKKFELRGSNLIPLNSKISKTEK